MKHLPFYCCSLLLIFTSCTAPQPDRSITTITPEEMCGTVQFSDGCGESLDSLIAYGIALVHHMTYEEAETIFDQVISRDPDCFWGHWGKAMTFLHPLWPDRISPEKMQHGQILTQRAMTLARKDREKLFGEALAAYYRKGQEREEMQRLASYEAGWKTAHENLPEDAEATAFYALSMLANVSPKDKSYEKQRTAGAMAESVINQIPDHPGGFHYAIHAYDFPPLAHKALEVADNYGKIAPEIPHALHMPSHIFTRKGYWEKSIHWNKRSSEAAVKRQRNGRSSVHNLHALDYLTYAHLQLGEDEEAEDIARIIEQLEGPVDVSPGTAYALAAIPARLALELRNWEAAATLETPLRGEFAWEKFPQYETLVHFARGLGAARTGQMELAKEALTLIDQYHSKLLGEPEDAYWAMQVEIKKKALEAWIALAEGEEETAVDLMRASAELEASTDKNPVTPGELLPAYEMLGDLYMILNKPDKAVEAYEKSLETSPNRLNTLLGLCEASKESGKISSARMYLENLIELVDTDKSRYHLVARLKSDLGEIEM